MRATKKGAKRKTKKFSRRGFLVGGASVAASFIGMILPRHVLGGVGDVPPSEKINVACIGVGAQGLRVMMNFLQQPDVQITSVCDVNQESNNYSEWGPNELRRKIRRLVGKGYKAPNSDGEQATAGREPARRIVEAFYAKRKRAGNYRGCTAYADFRELLEKEKDLDAVIVGTPDHWHTLISVAAMKKGKHVYCQKPLTHSVYEARRIAQVAGETRVATQVAVGNQASEATRLLTEWIGAGAIGPVRQVFNWSTRPFWPQGMNRPEETEAVPPSLDWDMWLGPAPFRPYHSAYLPFVWRGWYDFGSGALGDMGCYSFDTIFRVLKLGPPAAVESSSTEMFEETYAVASNIHFDFPARGEMPPVRITWFDGGLRPPRPAEMDEGPEMSAGNEGLMFVGDDGKILCGFNGRNPRLIPKSRMKAYKQPPPKLPRSIGHDREWIEACKGNGRPGANFEFSGPVTEALLLGSVALQAGERLHWDSEKLAVSSVTSTVTSANRYIRRKYRGEWSL